MKASTGSNGYDREAEGEHEGVLDDGEIVTIPGEIPQQRIVVRGVSYVHKSEDAEGRWVYAPA